MFSDESYVVFQALMMLGVHYMSRKVTGVNTTIIVKEINKSFDK